MYMLVVHILYSQVLQKNVLKIQRLKNLLLQIQSYLTIVKTIKHQRIIAGLIAQAIVRVYERESVSVLFD